MDCTLFTLIRSVHILLLRFISRVLIDGNYAVEQTLSHLIRLFASTAVYAILPAEGVMIGGLLMAVTDASATGVQRCSAERIYKAWTPSRKPGPAS